VAAQAEAQAPEIAALHTRAAGLEAESVALLATVEGWQPEEDKLAGWSKADETEALRQEAGRRDVQREQVLTGALRIDPSLPEAHVALVERYRAAHAAAEQARQSDVAARAAHLLQSHADALPEDHPVRQSSAVYLKGDGALTLVTEPPGADVLLHRYELHNRRLVPVLQRSLGRTPLSAVSLPMGSYLCVLRSQGRADVRYPVHIGRGAHWHGVPPGGHEPQAIRVPPAAELGSDDCHVPAGWFTAGGDPAVSKSLSRRRVWVDGFCLSRFPVTNRDYIAFLDDLVVQGREEEALRHVPRERPGTQGESGALIYGYEGGRFSLRPDADGDVWLSDWPVCMVDWHGAVAFAAWQAAHTGQDWRLPHELEWEKAGRGVDRRFFPWGDAFDPSWCHTKDSHRGHLLPACIGEYPVDESVYGARGLAGNMRDWTGTAHQDDSDVRDGEAVSFQQGAGEGGANRVGRGGNWYDNPRDARLSVRFSTPPGNRVNFLGLRLARSIP
jgi:formylglycine-generating enzyme required for sulfatase activity